MVKIYHAKITILKSNKRKKKNRDFKKEGQNKLFVTNLCNIRKEHQQTNLKNGVVIKIFSFYTAFAPNFIPQLWRLRSL
jgi:hypothetical protein